jgi:rod shape-determining protein MreC
VIEGLRSNSVGFVRDYIVMKDTREENKRLRDEIGKLKMQNHFLRAELSTADRVKALLAFQERTPSRTLASRIIGSGTSATSKVVFIDRGSTSGVMQGMAVVTPDGIVGKVVASFPTASQVLLVTDPTFAAGVISLKNRVRGTLKGDGYGSCKVDYIQNEETVEQGEVFYTSGDDRIFPKGLPAGTVRVARPGKTFKEVLVAPLGMQQGLEEVLVVLEGAHQQLPDLKQEPSKGTYLGTPPPEEPASAITPRTGVLTDADRLEERYRRIGESHKYKFGEGFASPDFRTVPPPRSAPPAPNVPSAKPAPAAPPSGPATP